MMQRTPFRDTRAARASRPALDPRDPSVAGLVGWWPFASAGSVGAIAGAVGHEPALTLSSPAPAWRPDAVVGGALSANGNDAWAAIPSSPLFALSTMTASIWFRWTGSGGNRAIFSRWNSVHESWVLRASAYPGRPAFNVSTSNGNFGASAATNCEDGQWHHVVGTYDGAYTRLYLDGVLHESAASSGALDKPDTDVYLFRYSGEPTINDYFIGDLADARLYNRALSDAEVWRLWDPATRPTLGPRRRLPAYQGLVTASATLAGAARCSAVAALRRVAKSATFEPAGWGEFDNDPTITGSGAAIAQSVDAAFIDAGSEAAASEFGARLTLTAGDGSAFLEHATAESERSHARVMLRVPALAGGAIDVLAAVDASGDVLASLRLEPGESRLGLVLPGGAAIHYAIATGDWNRWRCVELTLNHADGSGTLLVDGVEVGPATAGEVLTTGAAAWRMGGLHKDHATHGTIDLDEWAIGSHGLGPPIVRPTLATLDDPARWLLVCNTAYAGSRDWADAYRWARRVPHANVLAIALPTSEVIDTAQAAEIRESVRHYLDATGLSLHVAGVLLGPGVPALVETGVLESLRSIGDWLTGTDAAAVPNPRHAAADSSLTRPAFGRASRVGVVACMDAENADGAIALLTRSLAIEQDADDGKDRRLFIDAGAAPDALAAAASRLDAWRTGVERMTLRLPTLPSGDEDAPPWSALERDGFVWGWPGETPADGAFIAGSGDRVFAFALPGSSGASPRLRATGGWARAAIDAGYAATATAAGPIDPDAVPDARAFFEALRRGWSLSEAWLAACPKLGAGLTLVGDPLLRVTFPRAGWDVYGPAASVEAMDFTRPTLALRLDQRAATLPESARPTADGRAAYAVRRVDEHGRSEAGLAAVSVAIRDGEIVHASPLAPAWPDYEGWPIGVTSAGARAYAVWDRPCRLRSIESVTLEASEAGGEPVTIATIAPGAWEARVECAVAITSVPRRFRWRIVSSAGVPAFTPWSAPASRPEDDTIPLHIRES